MNGRVRRLGALLSDLAWIHRGDAQRGANRREGVARAKHTQRKQKGTHTTRHVFALKNARHVRFSARHLPPPKIRANCTGRHERNRRWRRTAAYGTSPSSFEAPPSFSRFLPMARRVLMLRGRDGATAAGWGAVVLQGKSRAEQGLIGVVGGQVILHRDHLHFFGTTTRTVSTAEITGIPTPAATRDSRCQ